MEYKAQMIRQLELIINDLYKSDMSCAASLIHMFRVYLLVRSQGDEDNENCRKNGLE